MNTRLYVGNLSYDTTDQGLRQAFEAAGEVVSATVVTDRDSGRSRGFGFVEMASEDDAREAIDQLNDTNLDGRTIRVAEAQPRGGSNDRRGGGGGGRGGGGRSRW